MVLVVYNDSFGWCPASGAREQVAQWHTDVISGAVVEGGARAQ